MIFNIRMSASLLCLSASALMASLSITTSSVSADVISFSDFSDTSGLTINGDALTTSTGDGVVLRLSNASRFNGGSAFSTVPVDATVFSTSFRFRISNRGGLGGGADGLVFVVQAENAGVGGLGGGIGFDGIKNSIGVEFDTFPNSGDPSSNHLGIVTNGIANHGSGAPFTVDVSPDFDDGNIWFGWVDYDGTTLEVRTNETGIRPMVPALSRTLDVASILGQTTGFVGFTSATGNGFGNHDILDWSYTNAVVPEPSTLALAGLGLIALLTCGLRRRR